VAAVTPEGRLVAFQGDPRTATFLRSAAKPFQCLPLLLAGGGERFGLAAADVALICASHGGTPEHTRRAADQLARGGFGIADLLCGAHWPMDPQAAEELRRSGEAPTALHNNCSGKHAGFLCLACMLAGRGHVRQYAKGYVAPRHPVMRAVTEALQAATGHDLGHAPRGIDGCSIPTYAIPLDRLALAFAHVGAGSGLRPGHARAATRLRKAVARHPFMAAGSDRFDTRVMTALGERVYCKVGAEGVFCAAFPERGIGVAIKIDDGNTARAAEVAMAATIEAFVDLDDEQASLLRGLSELTLRNWKGIEVGALRATGELRDALSHAG
jgi:L-asparaginase II